MVRIGQVLKQGFTRVLKGVIRFYQWGISPILGQNCRFYPTCSQYVYEALTQHGPVIGLWLGCKRILHCQPWSSGGYDPVPLPRGRCNRKINTMQNKI